MRLTLVQCQQHLGRMFSRHWYIQGKRKIYKTNAEEIVTQHGYKIVDGFEMATAKERHPFQKFDIVGAFDKPIPRDENHPDYQQEPCFIYKDEDVLLEGLQQAKVLTNTVEISDNLPESLLHVKQPVAEKVHENLKKGILMSCVFEATQRKLPKRKDPLRPAWNFPRDYGITDVQKNDLLTKNLLTSLELFGNKENQRNQIINAEFAVPLRAFDKSITFELTSELCIMSEKSLEAVCSPSDTIGIELPNLGPLDATISLKSYHFYDFKDYFPLKNQNKFGNVHTAIVHFNHTVTTNLFDVDVTNDQKLGRSLMKAFTIAASQARNKYGTDLNGDLPKPIVIQLVQVDGQNLHFCVFQLNTLAVDRKGENVKNVFWNSEPMPLYDRCCYYEGRPVLEKYDPAVFDRLMTFYNN